MKKENKEGMSRRSFLKGSLLPAGSYGFLSCSSGNDPIDDIIDDDDNN